MLCEDGKVGRTLRSVVLGSVADLPTRRDAQVRLHEELRAVNQGTVRPESSMLFGTFAAAGPAAAQQPPDTLDRPIALGNQAGDLGEVIDGEEVGADDGEDQDFGEEEGGEDELLGLEYRRARR